MTIENQLEHYLEVKFVVHITHLMHTEIQSTLQKLTYNNPDILYGSTLYLKSKIL